VEKPRPWNGPPGDSNLLTDHTLSTSPPSTVISLGLVSHHYRHRGNWLSNLYLFDLRKPSSVFLPYDSILGSLAEYCILISKESVLGHRFVWWNRFRHLTLLSFFPFFHELNKGAMIFSPRSSSLVISTRGRPKTCKYSQPNSFFPILSLLFISSGVPSREASHHPNHWLCKSRF